MRGFRGSKPGSVLRRFVISYLSLAMFALALAAGVSMLFFSRELRREERAHIDSLVQMAANGLQTQLDSVSDMADGISIRREYMLQYFTQNYESEQEMMRLLRNGENLLPFSWSYYLQYRSMDAVYSGRAKYTYHIFYDYLMEPAIADAFLAMPEEGICAAGGSLLLRFPVSVLHTRCDLLVVLPGDAIRGYLAGLIGVEQGMLSLAVNGACFSGSGEGAFSAALGSDLSVILNYSGHGSALSDTLLRCLVALTAAALVVTALAIRLSYNSYGPIKRISDSVIDDQDETDELRKIERILELSVTGYQNSRRRVSELSFLVGEQGKALRRQYLRLIIHKGMDSVAPEELEAAGVHLAWEYTMLATLPLMPADDMDILEEETAQLTSREETVFYAVQDGQRILMLINAVDRSALLTGMRMVNALFEGRDGILFSDIASSPEEIASLADALLEETAHMDIVRAEIGEIREAVLSSRVEDALSGLYELERSCRGSEDVFRAAGIRAELGNTLLETAAGEERAKLEGLLPAPLLSEGGEAYLHAMAGVVRTLCEAHRDSAERQRLSAHITAYIREHCGEYGMSLEQLSEVFGISSRQVRGEIKAETGMSYMDYLKNVRIHKAMEALAETDMSVAEIGEAVGYLNISYFIRIFREQTGYTPSIWRSVNR